MRIIEYKEREVCAETEKEIVKMLEFELVDLINKILQTKCESNDLEIKAARDGCPKLFDTLSSFSNQYGGGTIVFGID